MSHVFRRCCATGIAALALALLLPVSSDAQGSSTAAPRSLRRLGGPAAFYTPPLRSAASLKQMAAKPRMADDIRAVLLEGGIPGTADAVLSVFTGATTSVKGAFCDEATPADGVIVECDVRPGTVFLWMAHRPMPKNGRRAPGRIENVRWDGTRPFKALLFRVTNDYRIYTFVLPMACSNLSLMTVTEVKGEPARIAADRRCDPVTGALRGTFTASGKDLGRVGRVEVSLNGQTAGAMTAPGWSLAFDKPGTYAFNATDTRGRAYPVEPQTITIDACPLPAPVIITTVAPTCRIVLSATPAPRGYTIRADTSGSTTGTADVAPAVTVVLRDDTGVVINQPLPGGSSADGTFTVRRAGTYRASATVTTPRVVETGLHRYEGTATCDATLTIEPPVRGNSVGVFLAALGGKERRVRERDDTGLEFGQCSPLLGLKFGVARRFTNNWEVAGAAGGALSLVSDDDKVKEHVLFADVELNKYFANNVFIGTGLSIWDITRGDTFTPAWLLHFGLPVVKDRSYSLFFIGEGRVFFDNVGDIENNYQFWAGLRLHVALR
jgi:hypothetical protein